MKSEERHELETNSLAKFLSEGSDKLGPYASYLVYGVLAVVALWAIISLTTGNMRAKQEREWDSYTIATLPGMYDAVALRSAAEEYPNQPVGELADIAWADGQLTDGCNTYFSNKTQAMESLDGAAEAYQRLAKSTSNKVLKSRAQLGYAKALEAKGEIKDAIAAYEKVTGTFSEIADERVKELEAVDAEKYGDWLARATGSTRAPSFGAGGMPGFSPDSLGLPGDDTAAQRQETERLLNEFDRLQGMLPDSPAGDRYDATEEGDDAPKADPFADIPSPGAATETPAAEESSSEEPATEEPMTEEESTTEEAVVEEPTADEPAAEEPATETPAEETPAEEPEDE